MNIVVVIENPNEIQIGLIMKIQEQEDIKKKAEDEKYKSMVERSTTMFDALE